MIYLTPLPPNLAPNYPRLGHYIGQLVAITADTDRDMSGGLLLHLNNHNSTTTVHGSSLTIMVSGIGDRDGAVHLEDDGWRGRGHRSHVTPLFSLFSYIFVF